MAGETSQKLHGPASGAGGDAGEDGGEESALEGRRLAQLLRVRDPDPNLDLDSMIYVKTFTI